MTAPADLTIILLPPDMDLIRKKAGSLDPGAGVAWIYYGKDALLSQVLDRELSFLPRIPTGDRLQEMARMHRQGYIDFIGGLSARFSGIPWWLTSVSEKNPFYSDLFLNLCRMALLEELVPQVSGSLIVICETNALMAAIRDHLSERKHIRIDSPVAWNPRLKERSLIHTGPTLQICWFLLRYLIRVLLSRLFMLPGRRGRGDTAGVEKVVIHSWADDRALGTRGFYSDPFTGSLGPRLTQRSASVMFLVSLFPRQFTRGLVELKRAREEVHLIEEFITFADVFMAVWRVRQEPPLPAKGLVVQGFDLSSLVSHELGRDRLLVRRELSYLMYRAARRLGSRIKVRSFIYTFENHMWEKMVCLGLGETAHSTTRIGYAHSIVIPMNLSYSLSQEERKIVPLPHLIAVNGPRALKDLEESGFDPGMIFLSGALRYPHLLGGTVTRRGKGKNVVVVALPTAMETSADEALELSYKVLEAFGTSPDIQVILKSHPSVPPDRLISSLPPLPAHIFFSPKPTSTLLGEEAGLVLYTSSTVAVEAAARGIPVVHVRSDLAIDRNIFDGDPRVPSQATPAGIREAVLGLLGGERPEEEYPGDLVRGLFAPVQEENLGKFLGARSTDSAKDDSSSGREDSFSVREISTREL